MLSPLGGESWISRDNWNYTRSLIAEESPYMKLGYAPSGRRLLR